MTTTVPTHIRAGVKRKSIPIHYVVSKDGAGRDCWFVIICPYHTLREMLSGTELVKPEDYGYIVARGFGHALPADIKTMLAEDYGFVIKE